MNYSKVSVFAAAVLAAGCSHSGTVSKIATDYNRAMATTRDEQLLINILRAAGREPLMFSVVGEVTGTAQDGVSLETAATNLIAGGKNLISPTLGLEGSSGPTVQVKPLSSKEFTEGIMKPIKPATLNYFMSQGWDAEFLLPLVVSGYRCEKGGEANLNASHADLVAGWGANFSMKQTASDPALKEDERTVPDSEALRLMREGGPDGYTVKSVTDDPENPQMSKVVLVAPAVGDVAITVTTAEALKMMRSGVAGGYKVKAVLQESRPELARVVLTVPEEKGWEAKFGETGPTCPPPPELLRAASADGSDMSGHHLNVESPSEATNPKIFAMASESGEAGPSPAEAGKPSLQFRSVEGIIHYLGASFRPCLQRKEKDCSITYGKMVAPSEMCQGSAAGDGEAAVPETRYLFRLRSAGVPSATAAIRTRHNGNNYWVDRLDRCDTDRTLKTLSFLSQLIALQTEASDLAVTPSVIAVGGR